MNKNVIKINFSNPLKVLAGNEFGREVFQKQVESKFKLDSKNELVFPDTVKIICSSFVQGLFSKYLEVMSPEKIMSMLEIEDERIRKFIEQGIFE